MRLRIPLGLSFSSPIPGLLPHSSIFSCRSQRPEKPPISQRVESSALSQPLPLMTFYLKAAESALGVISADETSSVVREVQEIAFRFSLDVTFFREIKRVLGSDDLRLFGVTRKAGRKSRTMPTAQEIPLRQNPPPSERRYFLSHHALQTCPLGVSSSYTN